MPRRRYTQSFEDHEVEQAEAKLSPLEIATDRWLASTPGTPEALVLSGRLLAAMRAERRDDENVDVPSSG